MSKLIFKLRLQSATSNFNFKSLPQVLTSTPSKGWAWPSSAPACHSDFSHVTAVFKLRVGVSMGRFVCLSVRRSVGPSVCPQKKIFLSFRHFVCCFCGLTLTSSSIMRRRRRRKRRRRRNMRKRRRRKMRKSRKMQNRWGRIMVRCFNCFKAFFPFWYFVSFSNGLVWLPPPASQSSASSVECFQQR